MSKEPIAEKIDDREGTEDPEKVEEDGKEIADDSARKVFSTEGTAVTEAGKVVKQAVEMVSVAADKAVVVDVADGTYKAVKEQDKAKVKNDPPGTRIEAKKDEARDYRATEVGTQKRKGRLFARAKGINLLLAASSSVTSIIALIVTIRSAANAANGDDDGQLNSLTEEQREQLKAQIRRWWALPDAEVWNSVATYCDRWNPSWQAQILMMDEIKDLSQNLASGWNFRNDDEADFVDQIENGYADFSPAPKQNQSSAIYRQVATLAYDGFQEGTLVALPRQIAADVAELAVTGIILKENAAKESAAHG